MFKELSPHTSGPMSATFCFFQLWFKNALKWCCLIILDAIILAKYIFIFWLKNPGAVQDDFWSR
jgi:hypothetical protein